MFKIGSKVLVVSGFYRGRTGTIVDTDHTWGLYWVKMHKSRKPKYDPIFMEDQLVPIPDNATEDQVEAIRNICK